MTYLEIALSLALCGSLVINITLGLLLWAAGEPGPPERPDWM
jgi:hypothetical protein